MAKGEFVPDTNSPANNITTYALKIAPPRDDESGEWRVVKFRRASEWGYHMGIEPGAIEGYLGVRALQLWDASGALDYQPISLEAAKVRTGNQPSHIFLASARLSGGLAVTSCIGYKETRLNVPIPPAEELYTNDPMVNVALHDVAIPKTGGVILPHLLVAHLTRAEEDGFDPDAEISDPHHIDLELARLLEALPESWH
jgi:hypothetical protein